MTSHLAVLDQGEAVYVEKVEASGFFKVNTWVGRRMFVHSTSVGKVLVAWMPRPEVEAILREKGLKKRTPRTITSQGRFFAELERVRAHGYAVDDEENSLGARCVAAPVFDLLGGVEFALGISGTVSQMDDDTLPRVVEHLKDTARRISRQIQRVGPGGPG
jgi:DNA-binding IclR family transcriptional regulator